MGRILESPERANLRAPRTDRRPRGSHTFYSRDDLTQKEFWMHPITQNPQYYPTRGLTAAMLDFARGSDHIPGAPSSAPLLATAANPPPRRWYGGRHPSELSTEEFMFLHQTGWIPGSAYEMYKSLKGLQWLGTPRKYPWLVGQMLAADRDIELRQSGELNWYVSLDADGEIRRDEGGTALYMTLEEIRARDLHRFDRKIVAFDGEVPVGHVSDEWGAVGVWVAEPYQRLGIGTRLVRMYLEEDPRSQLGQMTDAGMALARAVHRSFCS
jgi:GNAT superfamily N-acetyltransferase